MGHPKMSSSWRLGAEVRAVAMEIEGDLHPGKGCASANVDVLAEDGDSYDADRIMFLRSYLIELIPSYPELSKRWQDGYCSSASKLTSEQFSLESFG
jgi:hypothetical protein